MLHFLLGVFVTLLVVVRAFSSDTLSRAFLLALRTTYFDLYVATLETLQRQRGTRQGPVLMKASRAARRRVSRALAQGIL